VAFGLALILMFAVVPGSMYIWFRRKGWLGSDSAKPADPQ
jgi:hypothetical protein